MSANFFLKSEYQVIRYAATHAGSAAAFDSFLRALKLKPEGGQTTKTRIALKVFAKRLGSARRGAVT